MAAGMFLFTVKLLVLFVAATRFTVLFTSRYAAPTSVNIVDKRECSWCFYNELLWHYRTSLALAALASQPLKSGTLSLHLSVPVPVLTPSVVTSRPTTASWRSTPLNRSPLAPQIRLC